MLVLAYRNVRFNARPTWCGAHSKRPWGRRGLRRIPITRSGLRSWTPFKEVIEARLIADLDAPRKHRHTATRIFTRLSDEDSMDDVSYPVVSAYVAKRRPQIRVEQGRGDPTGFVPQTCHPVRDAEVHFGEVAVQL